MNKPMKWLTILALWLLAMVAHAGTHHHYYTDPQGTVLARTDAQGNVIATYDYAPYGQAVASMSGAPDGPGYTGHVNDPETELVYMQARYYDPAVGRFLSVDPIGIGAKNGYSFNRYAYALNNPVGLNDPTGAYPLHMTASQINCEVYRCNITGDDGSERWHLARLATSAANKSLTAAGVLGKAYGGLKNLLTSWSDVVSPVAARFHVEIGADIMYMEDSGYLCSPAYSTGDKGMIIMEELSKNFVPGRMAYIHTHPQDVGFSGMSDWARPNAARAIGYGDLALFYDDHVDGYVALPGGAIYGWSYSDFQKKMERSGTWGYLKDSVFTVRGK